MVRGCAVAHDGGMNETQDRPDEGATQQDEFDPRRLRTIVDMRRSSDDRMLGGVCAGAAKYLNVDPVVVRVVIAVLTFVGLSGVILYLAAWFLLPSDDTGRHGGQSIAAEWFNLDKNEEQVRVIGLVAAGVLAALAIVGDNSWAGWAWWGLPWVILPLALLYWLFAVRPRRARTEATTSSEGVISADSEDTAVLPVAERQHPAPKRAPGSSALTGLTLSVAAIAVAITVLVDDTNADPSWTTYFAVALIVVTAGVLIGTFIGRAGPLIPVGLLLSVLLAVGLAVPSPAMGDRRVTPTTAAGVDGTYEHGLGTLRLDLSGLEDDEQLLGSTIQLENGAGDIKVTVPDGLNVAVDAEVDAGEVRAFGRKNTGTDVELVLPPDDPSQPALTLHIRETFGGIEVIER
jgi:phage shock protein PspC (stress-responsive transcriptional regulator)